MPLYDFVVLDEHGKPTDEMIEEIVPSHTTVLKDQYGRTAVRRGVQMIAHIPTRWGDSHSRWDPDLKAHVSSQRDIDRICEQRNLVPLADLPSHFLDSHLDKTMREEAHMQKVSSMWKAAEDRNGYDPSKGLDHPDNISARVRAQDEVMPMEAVLNGTCEAAKKLSEI